MSQPHPHGQASQVKPSTPVELDAWSTDASAAPHPTHDATEASSASSAPATHLDLAPPSQSHGSADEEAPLAVPQPALLRTETEAIGPSTDLPTPMLAPSAAAIAAGPTIVINLLLTSTGTRHPYKIDEKYLTKRGVTAVGEGGVFDPFVISVYTLKELIWRDWREEWEPRPSSPSAIRLIHFGRLLDDKLPLKDCRFSDATANVVHMSIKPQEVIDDEENAKAGGKRSMSRDRDGNERTPGCRCVIL
ncbi:hypothetical protein MBLNU459_g1229t1 [Dothideomycetes sp. NU459]